MVLSREIDSSSPPRMSTSLPPPHRSHRGKQALKAASTSHAQGAQAIKPSIRDASICNLGDPGSVKEVDAPLENNRLTTPICTRKCLDHPRLPLGSIQAPSISTPHSKVPITPGDVNLRKPEACIHQTHVITPKKTPAPPPLATPRSKLPRTLRETQRTLSWVSARRSSSIAPTKSDRGPTPSLRPHSPPMRFRKPADKSEVPHSVPRASYLASRRSTSARLSKKCPRPMHPAAATIIAFLQGEAPAYSSPCVAFKPVEQDEYSKSVLGSSSKGQAFSSMRRR